MVVPSISFKKEIPSWADIYLPSMENASVSGSSTKESFRSYQGHIKEYLRLL